MSANAPRQAHSLPILTFRLEDQTYALAIGDVVEVAVMVELIHLPGAPDEFLGMANRHGEALPMLDLRRIFGFAPRPLSTATLFVVAEEGEQRVGLVVDEVHQVEYVPFSHLRETTNPYIHRVISHKSGLIQMIALAPLLKRYGQYSAVEQEEVEGKNGL